MVRYEVNRWSFVRTEAQLRKCHIKAYRSHPAIDPNGIVPRGFCWISSNSMLAAPQDRPNSFHGRYGKSAARFPRLIFRRPILPAFRSARGAQGTRLRERLRTGYHRSFRRSRILA